MNNVSKSESTSFSVTGLIHSLDYIHLALIALAALITAIHVIRRIKHYLRLFRTRYLRKVWGIKNGDHVTVVCSELENAEERQNMEARNFIYNLRYGDVDAYFEVVINLLRLYPDIKLRILSSGEAEGTRIDMARHLILIGGPDYNSFTERILNKQITQYTYKSLNPDAIPTIPQDEMVLFDSLNNKEYYEAADEKDYGYFERIKNPDDQRKNLILIGGCRTLGVTGAAKAFSMAESEKGEIPKVVLDNAKEVAKRISRQSEFSVRFSAERVGQTIGVPIVSQRNITVKEGN